jgi:hypothetical protein
MNDPYDNSKTDREMLSRLASKDGDDAPEPDGDSTLSFTFTSLELPSGDKLTSAAYAAADVLKARGHGGPFTVTVTVACQDSDSVSPVWAAMDDGFQSARSTLAPPLELLLATYTDGPKIWDATVLVPGVFELERLGLIERVPDRGGAYQLTSKGQTYLTDHS